MNATYTIHDYNTGKAIGEVTMKSESEKVVWTVSQDGLTISGAYGGKGAKAKATKESGGKSVKMTYGQFRQKYPHLDVVFFDA